MVKYLGLELARKPNIFQEKHRVSKYYSSRMIIFQENVGYEKHLKIPFDPYVLANNKPKPINTNTPRRLEWIYLRATYSAQEGHDILHLQTNSVVTKNCVKLAPVIPTIVYQVHYINER